MTLPVRPRNWFSFNLRALLIVVTLFAVAFAAVTQYYLPFKRQRAAITALKGRYGYASQRPAGPAWMRRWFGEQNFQDVVELHLENMGTSDDDLRHVGQLPHLEKLYLAHNPKITDKGLVYLRGLPKLRRMSVYDTKVTGPGFEHLATCPELAEIDANTIPLTEEILVHLKKMPQLTWFATPGVLEEPVLLKVAEFPNNSCLEFRYGLNCKDFTDAAVPAFAKISGADTMVLQACRFSPTAWKEFRPPANCSDLWVTETPIPADMAVSFLEGGGTKKFQTLHIDSSSLRISSLIQHLPEEPVTSAWIHQDAIQISKTATLHLYRYSPPQEARELCANLRVQTLTIDIHEIGESVGQVKDVQELHVHCVATPQIFAGIGELKDLRVLNIKGMAIEDFSVLGNLHELETLILPPHNLPSEKFGFLANLTNLKHLKLSGNRMDAATMKSIGSMKQLHYLSIDFAGDALNDETFASLSGCRNLQFISCSGAPITDDSIEVLKNLPRLKFANLTGTKVTDEGRKSIDEMLQQRLAGKRSYSGEDFDLE